MVDLGKPHFANSQPNEFKWKMRKMSEFIFNKMIQGCDRLSILEYCLNIRVVCSLIEKSKSESTLRK